MADDVQVYLGASSIGIDRSIFDERGERTVKNGMTAAEALKASKSGRIVFGALDSPIYFNHETMCWCGEGNERDVRPHCLTDKIWRPAEAAAALPEPIMKALRDNRGHFGCNLEAVVALTAAILEVVKPELLERVE